MTLIAYSLSHQTAPLVVREKWVFSPEQSSLALKKMLSHGAANEALILSTCNRTELYAQSEDLTVLQQWLNNYFASQIPVTSDNWRIYVDQEAISHAMCVASGLEAMVLGESQILAQMKAALSFAHEQGTIGTQLHKLFQTTFMVAKQVRTHTAVAANPVSIAYAAVKLAKKIFANLSQSTVLLIGAGQNIELTAMHLVNNGVKRIIVANRSLDKARYLVNKFQAHVISIQDIPVYLSETDIIISSTASLTPILGKGIFTRALKIRKHRPIFIADLAVPRDIDPEVGSLEDIYLYNIDDLQQVVKDNFSARAEAAQQAKELIDIQAHYLMREIQSLNAVDTICAYRDKLNGMRDEEVNKALAMLAKGESAETVLQIFARGLINKIMHEPTSQLRQAALDKDWELLILARRFFGI